MHSPLLSAKRAALCAFVMASSGLSAAPIVWSTPGNGDWATASNWGGGTAPKWSDIAQIDGLASNRTVNYNDSTTALAGLLLGQAAAGFTNTLLINGAGTSGAPSLTIAGDVELGGSGTLGTAEIRLGAAASSAYLRMGASGTGTLTLKQGGLLSAGGATTYSQAASPVFDGNLKLSGGTLTINNAATPDTRLAIRGDFTATGGKIDRGIVNGNNAGYLNLQGAINSIMDTSVDATMDIYIGYQGATATQSFSTNVAVNALAFRAAQGVKTISSSATIGAFKIGSYAANSTLGFKLGSNITTTNGFVNGAWGGGASGANIQLDLNGHDFTVTRVAGLTLASDAAANWTITNATGTEATISADSIGGNGSSYVITGPVTLKSAGAFDFSAASSLSLGSGVTLQSGGGSSNLGSSGTIDPNARFYFTGASGILISGRTLGAIEVGNGVSASTLSRNSSALSLAGNLKINKGSTYNANGWGTTLSGAASIQGTGLYKAVNDSGSVRWSAGATGGLSAGDVAGQIGRLSFSAANSVGVVKPTLTLAATSISIFDIASLTDFDVIQLGAFNIHYDGTLKLNFLGAFIPKAGDAFNLFEHSPELSSTSEILIGISDGQFNSITSNLDGYTFVFDAASGVLAVQAIPEPSTVVLLAAAGLFLASELSKRRRSTC